MDADDVADCTWLKPGGAEAAAAIVAFLREIGISVVIEPVRGDALIPGLAVSDGAVRIDPAVPVRPGDVLHEAGHLAVTKSDARAGLAQVSADAGEEMATIAWSVAAARASGVGLDVLFHDDGYKGGAAAMRDAFADGRAGLGVPLLAWFGMTAEPHRAAETGIAAFPEMQRWLR